MTPGEIRYHYPSRFTQEEAEAAERKMIQRNHEAVDNRRNVDYDVNGGSDARRPSETDDSSRDQESRVAPSTCPEVASKSRPT